MRQIASDHRTIDTFLNLCARVNFLCCFFRKFAMSKTSSLTITSKNVPGSTVGTVFIAVPIALLLSWKLSELFGVRGGQMAALWLFFTVSLSVSLFLLINRLFVINKHSIEFVKGKLIFDGKEVTLFRVHYINAKAILYDGDTKLTGYVSAEDANRVNSYKG